MRTLPRVLALPAALVLLLSTLLTSCSSTDFDPFDETDRLFSIFGFLDANADTQWVRITPLRQRQEGLTDLDATVTLEDVSTGEVVVLRDSLFRFARGPVHNFWTVGRLRPEATYRLTARQSDGAASTVDVLIPEHPGSILLDTGANPISTYWTQAIRVEGGGGTFADFRMIYTVQTPNGAPQRVEVVYLPRVRKLGDRWVVSARLYDDLSDQLRACPTVLRAEVVIATAEPGWPDLWDVDIETIAIPGRYSNVRNGVGYVGGVASARIEWREVLGALHRDRDDYCRY